jgi:hypothetical protein
MLADDGTLVAQANDEGQEEVVYADWAALTPRRRSRPPGAPDRTLAAAGSRSG